MGKIIAVVNQKGGVGKTTTAVNLGAYLAQAGKSVLLVDVDPQANASSGLGVDFRQVKAGIYEALISKARIFDVIKRTKQSNYYLAPATPALAGAAIELIDMEEREFRLFHLLSQVREEYDYIIIDGPPSLGLLTINSLTAADEVLIPIQSEYYALEGLGQLLETIALIQNNLKPSLGILGAVITMYDKRNRLSEMVKKEIDEYFPQRVFKTLIPRSVKLAEAPSYGQSILAYQPQSRGALAYQALATEILALENN